MHPDRFLENMETEEWAEQLETQWGERLQNSGSAFVLFAKGGDTLTWPTGTAHMVVTIEKKFQLGLCLYENVGDGAGLANDGARPAKRVRRAR